MKTFGKSLNVKQLIFNADKSIPPLPQPKQGSLFFRKGQWFLRKATGIFPVKKQTIIPLAGICSTSTLELPKSMSTIQLDKIQWQTKGFSKNGFIEIPLAGMYIFSIYIKIMSTGNNGSLTLTVKVGKNKNSTKNFKKSSIGIDGHGIELVDMILLPVTGGENVLVFTEWNNDNKEESSAKSEITLTLQKVTFEA